MIFFFSTKSGMTATLTDRLGFNSRSIPSRPDEMIFAETPFVLICPTYGGGEYKGAVPSPVIRFLNDKRNRERMLGVIATGNRNFGDYYGLAGDIISDKCAVPLLGRVELSGTDRDIDRIRALLTTRFPETFNDLNLSSSR